MRTAIVLGMLTLASPLGAQVKSVDVGKGESLTEGNLSILVSVDFKDTYSVNITFKNTSTEERESLDAWLRRLKDSDLVLPDGDKLVRLDAYFHDDEKRRDVAPPLGPERKATARVVFNYASPGDCLLFEMPGTKPKSTVRFKLPRSLWDRK